MSNVDIIIALIAGFALDLIIGDPQNLYHPVQAIGTMINKGEKLCRKIFKNEFVGGMVMSVSVITASFLVPYAVLKIAYRLHRYAGLALQIIFCYQILATKCLKDESMRVYRYVKAGDIENSRKYVGYIVGRDTQNLTFTEITKATVETVAENTSDGVIAPMIYFIIGGAPLAFMYKAVNTLDSMVGYKNDKYLYFGRFAAKTDDVFNFIPAVFSALMMIVASALAGFDFKNAVKIYSRDRHNHASPNSAKTESVAAGALGIELAGDAYYFGKLYKKPTIGDKLREIEADDIKRMNRLMYFTAGLSVILLSALRLIAIF